jgi:predicted nucleic acid-binding protein
LNAAVMIILADTNVLLRVSKPDDVDHDTAMLALDWLRTQGNEIAIVPQCGYEYYVVATRPIDRNGLGLEPGDAIRDLDRFIGVFRLMRDERRVFETWKSVIAEFQVRGKTAHDARLVAAMRRHGVTHLLSFNIQDFKRYEPEITLLDPHQVVTGP